MTEAKEGEQTAESAPNSAILNPVSVKKNANISNASSGKLSGKKSGQKPSPNKKKATDSSDIIPLDEGCIVCKPKWIKHGKNSALYTVECHPKIPLFATAGADSVIKLWDLRKITEGKQKENEGNEKLEPICSLTNHTYPVSCVRFSKCGKYMASGGDDRAVFIWKQFSPSDLSSWRLASQFHGHSMDIQDLAWDPTSQYLASCSVDNLVIVWNAANGAKVTTLTGHKDWVRGVAWDPLGKYLASLGADGSLCIWDASNDFKLGKRITQFFSKEAGLKMRGGSSLNNMFFTRIDWSPDGSFLFCSFGFEQQVSISPVLSRDSWTIMVKLVGHSRPTTVVKCSPRMFKGDDGTMFNLSAVAGMDRKVTVWSSASKRAIAIFDDFFEDTIFDISWCEDAESFIACSMDGTIAYFHFGRDEIKGQPLSRREHEASLVRLKGQRSIDLPDLFDATESTNMDTELPDFIEPLPVEEKIELSSEEIQRKQKINARGGKKVITPVVLDTLEESSGSQNAPITDRMDDVLVSRMSSKRKASVDLIGETGKRFKTIDVSLSTIASSYDCLLPQVLGKDEFVLSLENSKSNEHLIIISGDEGISESRLSISVKKNGPDEFSVVTMSEGESKKWMQYIPGRVTCGCGDDAWVALGTVHGFLHFLDSRLGSKCFPGVKLASTVGAMHKNAMDLLVLLTNGDILLFDVHSKKRKLRCTLRDLLPDSSSKKQDLKLFLNCDGRICAVVSGDQFTFDSGLDAWICMKDKRYSSSEFTSSSLQVNFSNFIQLSNSTRSQQVLETVSQLENALNVSLVLHSPTDYKRYLESYVTYLSAISSSQLFFANRLKKCLQDLLGPVHRISSTFDSDGWKETVLGLDKRNLLRELLPIVKMNRGSQSIYNEFQEKLQLLENPDIPSSSQDNDLE